MTIRARESVSMNAHNVALFIANARIDELPKQFNSSFIASIDNELINAMNNTFNDDVKSFIDINTTAIVNALSHYTI